jgi:multicomponent Na+:H+ antiporter subunit A
MHDGILLPIVLGSLFVAAALVPPVERRLGRETGYVLAVLFGAGALALVPGMIDAVRGAGPEFSVPWIPSLGVRFTLRLDALGVLFVGLVLGIGVLVMAYAARYQKPGAASGRLLSQLTLFAGSMLGLVLAGDAVLLFVFWELTSISSFLLIGGTGGSDSARPAMRAFVVTGSGGLALLGGLVLLILASGTSDLAAIMANGETVRDSVLFPAIAVLLLIGAATKSAQFPFHFWLPGAMVAPTPVSAYLHSATMVKAGIYLLMRTTPLFEGVEPWTVAVVLLGLGTSVMAGALALKQHDLKALLAYSTISQLGIMVALTGVGTHRAMMAATVLLVAHSLYKVTLFMVVGIIDHEAGSRDIRELSGLRRAMPITAVATGLAALSMAGVPLLLGFVSKEEAFGAFLSAPGAEWLGPLAGALAVTASAMTFAYGVRIFEGAFEGPLRDPLYEPALSFLAPAAIPAAAGLILGPAVLLLDPLAVRVAGDTTGGTPYGHLALWHGFTPALAMSAITIALGVVLVAARRRVDRYFDALRWRWSGAKGFDGAYDGVLSAGARVASWSEAAGPAPYLSAVLGTVVVGTGLAWLRWYGTIELLPPPPIRAVDWPVLLLLTPAVAIVVVARDRIAAIAALGLVGFAVALLYALIGAPDLAITQVLVETLTVALIVLVFRRLPRRFASGGRRRSVTAAATAAVVGVAATVVTQGLTGRRPLSDAGRYFLERSEAETGGRNVVNAILVDFRALDTLGEIAVLALAALGAVGLVAAVRRGRSA